MIEETLKQIAEELKGIRKALEYRNETPVMPTIKPKPINVEISKSGEVEPRKEAAPEDSPEAQALRSELDKRCIRYSKKATIEQLKEKIRVDDEKKARVAKAKEKKSEKAAEPAPPVKGDTPEDRQAKVRDLLKAYAYKFGGEKAMAVLKKFDASKISEIAVADLDKFIAEITIEG